MFRNVTVLSVLSLFASACAQNVTATSAEVVPDQRSMITGPSVGPDPASPPSAAKHGPWFGAVTRSAHLAGEEGVWIASNGAFVARFDGVRNRVSPLHISDDGVAEKAPIGLATDGEPVAAPRIDEDGSLKTDFGSMVETWAMHAAGVEQSWELAQRPEGEEDLVVRVAVDGAEFLRQDAFGLRFLTSDGVELTYSDATWIDATGRDAHVTSSWVDGYITLRVSREVLDASTFPAVLDPTLTAEVAVDAAVASSPTGAASQLGGVAFSGNQYLAVWADNRDEGNADIYGMRLSTTGAIQDTTSLPIARVAGVQAAPVVAYVGGINYLVVWLSSGNLNAARVTTGGVVTQLGVVASTADTETKPEIVARGTEALVVYQTGNDVKAVRYSGGTFGAPFAVAASADVETDPAVASNPSGDYLVTYTRGAAGAGPDIRGQLVTSGGALSGAAFDVSAGAGGQTTSAATFAGGNFIVVWANNKSGVRTYGTRISTAGAVLDTHLEGTVTVGGTIISNGIKEGQPSIACNNASTCLVSWRDARGTTNYDIYGTTVTTALAPVKADFAISLMASAPAARAQVAPRVVAAGADFFVAWNDDREGMGNNNSYGARVTSAGVVSDVDGILIARGNNRQSAPTLARSGNGWFIAWTDSRVRGNNINGSRVNSQPKTTDTPVLNVSNATYSQTFPSATVNSKAGLTDYFVTWADNRGGGLTDIYAARVSPSNTTANAVLDTSGIAISTGTTAEERPDVTSSSSTGNYLIVWSDRRNGNPDIYGSLVTAGGVAGTPFAISTAPSSQLTPAVGYDPTANQFLVVWTDMRSTKAGQIWGARVSNTGVVLDTNGVQISGATGIEPQLTYGSDRFLVVWRATDNIYARRVQTSSSAVTLNDAAPITVCSATDEQSQPTLVYLEDSSKHFAVAWSDSRNRPTTQSDLYGVNVLQSTGALDGGEYVIANTADAESRPQFSRGKLKKQGQTVEALLGYTRNSTTEFNKRTEMKKLTFNL